MRWLAIVGALAIAIGCGKPTDDAGTPRPNTAGGEVSRDASSSSHKPERRGPDPMVVFEAKSEVRVPVEVVRTPREVQRGLMYREHLPPDRGMLFLMGEEEVQTFWMKNTLIPLDMIFVTKEMVVAGVVENAEPLTESQRTIGKPSQFVVEVNAGFARANGIGAGTRVTFEHLP